MFLKIVHFFVNPFLTNRVFQPYQLDESVSVSGVAGKSLHFYCILHRNPSKQAV